MNPIPAAELTESNFQFVAAWRAFAASSPSHDIRDVRGLAIAWRDVSLPFLNAVFLWGSVASKADFQDRVHRATAYMKSKSHAGMFVVCSEWLPDSIRGEAAAIASANGLHPALSLTGMAADQLLPPVSRLPALEYRRVGDAPTMRAISDINCLAYGLPLEIGRASLAVPDLWTDDRFGCVAYSDGKPVAASATFAVAERLYVGLVATVPEMQRRGYGEAVMRYSLEQAAAATGLRRTILHATEAGLPLYKRMGYHATAAFTAYMPSEPAG